MTSKPSSDGYSLDVWDKACPRSRLCGLLYHRQFDYHPTMKVLYYSAIVFAIICLSLAALNAYDFLYRDDLPWKEGDFKAVMLLCIGGVAVFSLIALLLRHAVKVKS